MKNRELPGGSPIGPKAEWGKWRAARDKRLREPRRNKAAQKLNAPRKEPAP